MSHIDPGVEDRIKQSAEDVEGERKQEEEQEEALDTDTKQPSRWWFASTACPLLAGTFGPIASGFNICALVYQWRQYIPPGGTESTSEHAGLTLPDPPWLIGLNAASLVCALVGNASLLLNMAQRVRFAVAQPITIVGFLLAGLLLIADLGALSGSPNHAITRPEAIPHDRHAFTGAFYYGIFAASIYVIIAGLMFMTVHGANRGHFGKEFRLTAPQRTLMLQTMSFIAYLLLGALVYSHIEGWQFLNAVYWADVTLLTVGLGEFSPSTSLGQGLLFPFAIGGILMVGLVVGSIRSLVLDRGKEKLSARIVEKKRSKATHHVDERTQSIRISPFAKANFSTDPALSQAQRRKEEFNAMRKVQHASERERRWFGLFTSGAIALILWLVGAAIFQQTEHTQQWTYLQALYFSYTSLLTIGYGDFHPQSNSGKAFFVIWSLLAVPSLTILISNMGDTIVKWFSDATVSIAAITVLPGDEGFRAGIKAVARDITESIRASLSSFTGPGIFGDFPRAREHQGTQVDPTPNRTLMAERLAEKLSAHAAQDDELNNTTSNAELQDDIHFYHYVLSRECRKVQKDLNASPPKQYSWADWEYFLKLVGDRDDDDTCPVQDLLIPQPMRAHYNINARSLPDNSASNSQEYAQAQHAETADAAATSNSSGESDNASLEKRNVHAASKPSPPNQNDHSLHRRNRRKDWSANWSWLSHKSPLMSSKSEAEWILDRLSAALERELNCQRRGHTHIPPIGLRNLKGNWERGEEIEGEKGAVD